MTLHSTDALHSGDAGALHGTDHGGRSGRSADAAALAEAYLAGLGMAPERRAVIAARLGSLAAVVEPRADEASVIFDELQRLIGEVAPPADARCGAAAADPRLRIWVESWPASGSEPALPLEPPAGYRLDMPAQTLETWGERFGWRQGDGIFAAHLRTA